MIVLCMSLRFKHHSVFLNMFPNYINSWIILTVPHLLHHLCILAYFEYLSLNPMKGHSYNQNQKYITRKAMFCLSNNKFMLVEDVLQCNVLQKNMYCIKINSSTSIYEYQKAMMCFYFWISPCESNKLEIDLTTRYRPGFFYIIYIKNVIWYPPHPLTLRK